MLTEKERTSLLSNPNTLNKEISELRNRLNNLNEQKEFWFSKKEELKKQVIDLIKKIKAIKLKKDRSTEIIPKLKSERDNYNSEVKSLIKKIKTLNKEKENLFKKYEFRIDPASIQSKIEQIENRLEIEVSFDREKKLMTELKKLKKIYQESSNLMEQIKVTQYGIENSKKKADEFHNRFKEFSKESMSYDEFINLSRNINELRKEQEDAFQKFIDYKKQFLNTNQILKNKLIELARVKEKLDQVDKTKKLKHEETLRQRLLAKTKYVWEKLKSKKKLTTDDIIAFQEPK